MCDISRVDYKMTKNTWHAVVRLQSYSLLSHQGNGLLAHSRWQVGCYPSSLLTIFPDVSIEHGSNCTNEFQQSKVIAITC